MEQKIGNIFGFTGGNYAGNVYDKDHLSPTLNTMQGGCKQPMIIDEPKCLNSKGGRNNQEGLQPSRKDRVYDSNGIAPTIATSDFYNPCYTDKYRIRKLTPLECWRLMGFDDEDFYKAAKGKTDAQLYKQAGNSIVVNVLEAILRMLFHMERDYEKVPRYKSLW